MVVRILNSLLFHYTFYVLYYIHIMCTASLNTIDNTHYINEMKRNYDNTYYPTQQVIFDGYQLAPVRVEIEPKRRWRTGSRQLDSRENINIPTQQSQFSRQFDEYSRNTNPEQKPVVISRIFRPKSNGGWISINTEAVTRPNWTRPHDVNNSESTEPKVTDFNILVNNPNKPDVYSADKDANKQGGNSFNIDITKSSNNKNGGEYIIDIGSHTVAVSSRINDWTNSKSMELSRKYKSDSSRLPEETKWSVSRSDPNAVTNWNRAYIGNTNNARITGNNYIRTMNDWDANMRFPNHGSIKNGLAISSYAGVMKQLPTNNMNRNFGTIDGIEDSSLLRTRRSVPDCHPACDQVNVVMDVTKCGDRDDCVPSPKVRYSDEWYPKCPRSPSIDRLLSTRCGSCHEYVVTTCPSCPRSPDAKVPSECTPCFDVNDNIISQPSRTVAVPSVRTRKSLNKLTQLLKEFYLHPDSNLFDKVSGKEGKSNKYRMKLPSNNWYYL